MAEKDPFGQYLQQVCGSMVNPGVVYVRLPGYYAVHNRKPGTPAPTALFVLNDGAIAVFRGEPETREDAGAARVSPVYRLHPDGPLAVPTGLVLVRFADGVAAESRQEELARTGFEIAEIMAYAPQAAWVRPASGEIAAALHAIPALSDLADIENVEPQMLLQRVSRGRREI